MGIFEESSERFRKYMSFAENIKKSRNYSMNYFIHSLFVFFEDWKNINAKQAKNIWKYILPRNQDKWYAVYVGIPYCNKRCSYCVYESYELENDSQLSKYVEKVLAEINYFSDAFKNIKFTNFYFGGGTPSLLKPAMLGSVLGVVDDSFKFHSYAQRCVEFNPDSSTKEKLLIAHKHGIGRISFGVQSLDKEVLEFANRSQQTKEDVVNSIVNAKEIGFDSVNVDLIMGLWKDTPETFIETFKTIASIKPTEICIYPLQPMQDYVEKIGETTHVIQDRVRSIFSDIKEPVLEVAKKHGYVLQSEMYLTKEVTSWGFALKGQRGKENKSYFFMNPQMFGCVGFGPGSISKVPTQFLYQQETFAGKRVGVPFDPEILLYRGRKITKRTEMIKFIFDAFISPSGCMSMVDFRERFKIDFFNVFDVSVKQLQSIGKIIIDGDKISLKPTDPKEFFASAMFFFDHKMIDKVMAQYV